MMASVGLTRRARLGEVLGVAICVVTMMGCGDDDSAADLRIVDPMGGARLTLIDDTNVDADGIQYNVQVEAERLDPGETVSVIRFVPGTEFDPDSGTLLGVGPVDDRGVAVVPVTFPAGSHDLWVCARDCNTRSRVPVNISVNDNCATISFVSPMPTGSGNLTFGPGDDTDGMACGMTFRTTVEVATDAGNGTEARLFVNGTPAGLTNVVGTVARFEAITFGNRGDEPNRMRFEVTNAGGVTCGQAFPADIFVDCDGPSCAITAPDADREFLNADDDTSAEDGFQTDFQVTSSGEAVGQVQRLIVDGNESSARTAAATAMGTSAVASFSNVRLGEGMHTIQAECRDASGNVVRSSEAMWTVDTVACEIAIASPATDEVITDLDDLDGATDGIQIEASGTIEGTDCVGFRTGTCSAIETEAFEPSAPASWTGVVDLSSAASQSVCAEVQDAAGNVGQADVAVTVRTDAPQVEILSPISGTRFNKLGNADAMGRTYVADAIASTPVCDVGFSVACSEVGVAVDLLADGSRLATAPCEASGGTLAGTATFASVPLPLAPSFMHRMTARQTVSGLVGTSDALVLAADCQRPALSVFRPTCGGSISSANDSNPGLDGFQTQVVISNPNSAPSDVQLVITVGDTQTYTDVSTVAERVGINHLFDDATFGAGGEAQIVATSTDSFGNVGTTPACPFVVGDVPELTIDSPGPDTVVNVANVAASDCDPGTEGIQLEVTGTTSAVDGSTYTITVNGEETVGAILSGVFSECVHVGEGVDIVVRVAVQDANSGFSAMGMRAVTVDSFAPPSAIDPVSVAIISSRAGTARLDFTAVADADGTSPLTAYSIRCAEGEINDLAGWNAAFSVPAPSAPAGPGAMEGIEVGGFKPGLEYECVVRGADPGGNLTPLPADPGAALAPTFQTLEIAAPEGFLQFGQQVVALGDIDGDTHDDFAVSALDHVLLYFGGPNAGAIGAPVLLAGEAGLGFGAGLAALGDINGDGLGDLGVSARDEATNDGAVYVFLGREDWSNVTVSPTGCAADLCYRPALDSDARLGWVVVGAGDFDGDGNQDFAFSARSAGRVYVILGQEAFTVRPAGMDGVSLRLPADNPDGFVIQGSASEVFGQNIAAPGDVAAGPREDLVVTTLGIFNMTGAKMFTISGRAHAASSGLVSIGAVDVVRVVTDMSLEFGHGLDLRALGDFDGDGSRDLSAFVNNSSIGGARLYFGDGSGFGFAESSLVMTGTSASNDRFARTMANSFHPWLGTIGDIDGDGRADALLGSQERLTDPGTVELVYGRRTPSATIDRLTASNVATLQLGGTGTIQRIPGTLANVIGERFNDFAVGDPTANSGAGRVIVYY